MLTIVHVSRERCGGRWPHPRASPVHLQGVLGNALTMLRLIHLHIEPFRLVAFTVWPRRLHAAYPDTYWDTQVVFDREVVTTVPKDVEPKGVVFSLHGCLQMATEWGFQSPTCPSCHGERPMSHCICQHLPAHVPTREQQRHDLGGWNACCSHLTCTAQVMRQAQGNPVSS